MGQIDQFWEFLIFDRNTWNHITMGNFFALRIIEDIIVYRWLSLVIWNYVIAFKKENRQQELGKIEGYWCRIFQ